MTYNERGRKGGGGGGLPIDVTSARINKAVSEFAYFLKAPHYHRDPSIVADNKAQNTNAHDSRTLVYLAASRCVSKNWCLGKEERRERKDRKNKKKTAKFYGFWEDDEDMANFSPSSSVFRSSKRNAGDTTKQSSRDQRAKMEALAIKDANLDFDATLSSRFIADREDKVGFTVKGWEGTFGEKYTVWMMEGIRTASLMSVCSGRQAMRIKRYEEKDWDVLTVAPKQKMSSQKALKMLKRSLDFSEAREFRAEYEATSAEVEKTLGFLLKYECLVVNESFKRCTDDDDDVTKDPREFTDTNDFFKPDSLHYFLIENKTKEEVENSINSGRSTLLSLVERGTFLDEFNSEFSDRVREMKNKYWKEGTTFASVPFYLDRFLHSDEHDDLQKVNSLANCIKNNLIENKRNWNEESGGLRDYFEKMMEPFLARKTGRKSRSTEDTFRNLYREWSSTCRLSDNSVLLVVRKDVWMMWHSAWMQYNFSSVGNKSDPIATVKSTPGFESMVRHWVRSSSGLSCLDKLKRYNVHRKLLCWYPKSKVKYTTLRHVLTPDNSDFGESCDVMDNMVRLFTKTDYRLETFSKQSYRNPEEGSFLKGLVSFLLIKKKHAVDRRILTAVKAYYEGNDADLLQYFKNCAFLDLPKRLKEELQNELELHLKTHPSGSRMGGLNPKVLEVLTSLVGTETLNDYLSKILPTEDDERYVRFTFPKVKVWKRKDTNVDCDADNRKNGTKRTMPHDDRASAEREALSRSAKKRKVDTSSRSGFSSHLDRFKGSKFYDPKDIVLETDTNKERFSKRGEILSLSNYLFPPNQSSIKKGSNSYFFKYDRLYRLKDVSSSANATFLKRFIRSLKKGRGKGKIESDAFDELIAGFVVPQQDYPSDVDRRRGGSFKRRGARSLEGHVLNDKIYKDEWTEVVNTLDWLCRSANKTNDAVKIIPRSAMKKRRRETLESGNTVAKNKIRISRRAPKDRSDFYSRLLNEYGHVLTDSGCLLSIMNNEKRMLWNGIVRSINYRRNRKNSESNGRKESKIRQEKEEGDDEMTDHETDDESKGFPFEDPRLKWTRESCTLYATKVIYWLCGENSGLPDPLKMWLFSGMGLLAMEEEERVGATNAADVCVERVIRVSGDEDVPPVRDVINLGPVNADGNLAFGDYEMMPFRYKKTAPRNLILTYPSNARAGTKGEALASSSKRRPVKLTSVVDKKMNGVLDFWKNAEDLAFGGDNRGAKEKTSNASSLTPYVSDKPHFLGSKGSSNVSCVNGRSNLTPLIHRFVGCKGALSFDGKASTATVSSSPPPQRISRREVESYLSKYKIQCGEEWEIDLKSLKQSWIWNDCCVFGGEYGWDNQERTESPMAAPIRSLLIYLEYLGSVDKDVLKERLELEHRKEREREDRFDRKKGGDLDERIYKDEKHEKKVEIAEKFHFDMKEASRGGSAIWSISKLRIPYDNLYLNKNYKKRVTSAMVRLSWAMSSKRVGFLWEEANCMVGKMNRAEQKNVINLEKLYFGGGNYTKNGGLKPKQFPKNAFNMVFFKSPNKHFSDLSNDWDVWRYTKSGFSSCVHKMYSESLIPSKITILSQQKIKYNPFERRKKFENDAFLERHFGEQGKEPNRECPPDDDDDDSSLLEEEEEETVPTLTGKEHVHFVFERFDGIQEEMIEDVKRLTELQKLDLWKFMKSLDEEGMFFDLLPLEEDGPGTKDTWGQYNVYISRYR
jgi:hypothetical protein